MGAEAFDHAYEDDLTDMKVRLQSLMNLGIVTLTFLTESAVQISALNGRVDHFRQVLWCVRVKISRHCKDDQF